MVTLGQKSDEVARFAVINSLVFEGIDGERAKRAIKGAERYGTVVYAFLEWGTKESEWTKRKAPMIFVEVMPSVLNELTKKDSHLLLPVSVIHPYSRWNSSLEKRIETAFKDFVTQKQPNN